MTESARDVVEEFLTRQRAMYAGGDIDAVTQMLADNVIWHVPGTSPIAGEYRGRDAVLSYFARRRALAGGDMRIVQHAAVAHDIAVVQLADGTAPLGGGPDVTWRTAGVYRISAGRVAEAWLVPLDLAEFDRAWRRTRRGSFRHVQQAPPQYCAASGALAQPRLLELLEAAFIECWRSRFGPLADSLGPSRRLTVAAIEISFLSPAMPDDDVSIDVALDRITTSSVRVHYDAFARDVRVADATARYVCLDAATGRPAPLPASVAGSERRPSRGREMLH